MPRTQKELAKCQRRFKGTGKRDSRSIKGGGFGAEPSAEFSQEEVGIVGTRKCRKGVTWGTWVREAGA